MGDFVPTLRREPYPAISPTLPQLSVKGKSVLITGGGAGIGRSIPHAFATAGAARIAISGRTESTLKSNIDELKEKYPDTEFFYFTADITDGAAIKSMFDSFGAPDILVNNAGFLVEPGSFKDIDLKEWWTGFEINVLGTAIVTQEFLRAKPEGKEAIVVTVNTAGAHLGTKMGNMSSYVAAKAAMLRFSEAIQSEHPEVRFVSIHPGGVQTDMLTKARLPDQPITNPIVVANFILWLASDEADFMTGRFAWVNWDVDELKAKKEEILQKDLLKYTLGGFST